MNNQMPFFMPPFNQPNNLNHNNNNYEKIIDKLNRIEKNIRILENRIAKLENNNKNETNYSNDDPTDMYII